MCFGPDAEALWPSVVDCSALRCVDIKLSVTSLHVSTAVKFERYTSTITDALATHMQTKIERYVRLKPTWVVLYWEVLTNQPM